MDIPKDSDDYIKKEINGLENDKEITIILNNTRDMGAVDVQTSNEIKTTKDNVFNKIKELTKDMHHGQIKIKLNERGEHIINILNKERFKKSKK